MVDLTDRVVRKAQLAAKTLNTLAPVRAVYLFGSQVEGKANTDSDIDLAAFMDGIENWDMQERAKAMAQVMKEAGFDVEAHLFPAAFLENPPRASFAQYVLRHGARLDLDEAD